MFLYPLAGVLIRQTVDAPTWRATKTSAGKLGDAGQFGSLCFWSIPNLWFSLLGKAMESYEHLISGFAVDDSQRSLGAFAAIGSRRL